MKDYSFVVWTRASGKPIKMGQLIQTGGQSRFTYDSNFIDINHYGLSALYPVDLFQDRTIPFQQREKFDFIPPIQALIPPRNNDNFQRQLILKYLSYNKVEIPNDTFEQNCLILAQSGHGGIGHIDVFENDDKALKWYEEGQQVIELHKISNKFGLSLKEFISWYEGEDKSHLFNIIGPTSTVGGAIPKLLLSISDDGWDHRIGLPSKSNQNDVQDIVLKIEKSASYPGIVELESLSLNLAKAAGFDVPEHFVSKINELPVIGINRFDRDESKKPIPVETIYTLLAISDPSITDNASSKFERIADLINQTKIHIFDERKYAKKHVFKSFLFSLITGNGDLHLENLSVVGNYKKKGVQFSKVYDPTLMRAYSMHNMIAPMSFGEYGEHDEKKPLAQSIKRFKKYLKITDDDMNSISNDLSKIRSIYVESIYNLKSLPQENKDRLIAVHKKMSHDLSSIL